MTDSFSSTCSNSIDLSASDFTSITDSLADLYRSRSSCAASSLHGGLEYTPRMPKFEDQQGLCMARYRGLGTRSQVERVLQPAEFLLYHQLPSTGARRSAAVPLTMAYRTRDDQYLHYPMRSYVSMVSMNGFNGYFEYCRRFFYVEPGRTPSFSTISALCRFYENYAFLTGPYTTETFQSVPSSHDREGLETTSSETEIQNISTDERRPNVPRQSSSTRWNQIQRFRTNTKDGRRQQLKRGKPVILK